jgi:hypothetical protein
MFRFVWGSTRDAAMWLGKEWLYWSRLVRYHVLKVVAAVRARDVNGMGPRRLWQAALLTLLLLVGGYFLGRVTAPGCAPVASAVCTEAQTLPPPPPAPMELERQIVIVTAAVVQPAPAAEAPPPAIVEAIPPLTDARRPERSPVTLTNDEVREMQAWLKAFGFDPGPIDGYAGAKTKAAIKRYQSARHTEETGELDRSLLRKVRREAGHS